MNILFLSTEGTKGGAAVVTARLVEALRAAGAEARMLVGRNCGDGEWMAQTGTWRRRIAKVSERVQLQASHWFSRSNMWKVSTGRFGAGVLSHPWVEEADVVVLGWISQGFVSIGDIKRMCDSGKRVVWWMHDLWCATGICHLPEGCDLYTQGCGCCPMLGREGWRGDISRRVWMRKMRVLRPLDIKWLAVSRRQRDDACRSPLLSGKDMEVLPHAFPVELYATLPGDGQWEGALAFMNGLRDRKLIVMGAARLDDQIKNLPMAIESLNQFATRHPEIAAECDVVFFGGLRDASVLDKLLLPRHYAGMLKSEELRRLYAASSVVLSTSRFETMGATLMEGMAAGATPVTFGCGGQADIVTHGVNGYIADFDSAVSVADCLAQALCSPFPREAQHKSVASRFSAGAIARKFLAIIDK